MTIFAGQDGFWAGKRVLVTGHTGFKGAWLSLWLVSRGASVFGLSLEPDTNPALFGQLGLAKDMDHAIGDIRDAALVRARVLTARPDIVLHLAAQSLVRRSYADPLGTWQTNVMGTLHVLEALRGLSGPCAAVMITTDKVYENREWVHAYRENDPLGGHDPYSSSKAGAEIALASWRSSFFPPDGSIALASARAGNVIGGGDWAENRIVPDCMRALSQGKAVAIRNPNARRPWQHVLEPLGGYLLLAQRLLESLQRDDMAAREHLADSFNFGPQVASNRRVSDLVAEIFRHWPGEVADGSNPNAPHEASELNLATEKAFHSLGWLPRWDFARTSQETVRWYREMAADNSSALARKLCLDQIAAYTGERDE